jgi:hypothetical protein
MVMSLRLKWAVGKVAYASCVYLYRLEAYATLKPFFCPAAAHARQHKGRVQGLRPEGAKELSPGFQPWVPATQKCALKVARA